MAYPGNRAPSGRLNCLYVAMRVFFFAPVSIVPMGRKIILSVSFPSFKRRAIFNCPYGTIAREAILICHSKKVILAPFAADRYGFAFYLVVFLLTFLEMILAGVISKLLRIASSCPRMALFRDLVVNLRF